ncbi:MAG: leucyl/phenylalanyl-tRNA--protein transferase [Pirellulales bacterium]
MDGSSLPVSDADVSRLPRPRLFPPAWQADRDGLLCAGGNLQPELLLDAYRHGIFPWPSDDQSPLMWWSPDPRAVIELDRFHASRRLTRTIRSGQFSVSCDRDFGGVIRACAGEHTRQGGTWITRKMIAAYERLHNLGHSHSIEVRQDDRLVGGVYGISLGGLFAAESMFHRVTDASKVALVHLVGHLRARGYTLLDIQQWTPHTGRFGASEIPRSQYLMRVAEAVELPVTFGDRLEGVPT